MIGTEELDVPIVIIKDELMKTRGDKTRKIVSLII